MALELFKIYFQYGKDNFPHITPVSNISTNHRYENEIPCTT